jgi:hypothetical protein
MDLYCNQWDRWYAIEYCRYYQKQLPNIKKINHFMEISAPFPVISGFNLGLCNFRDTYFRWQWCEIIVNQTAVYNGFIYAATAAKSWQERWPKNLIDYRWETIGRGSLVFWCWFVCYQWSRSQHKFDSVSNFLWGFVFFLSHCWRNQPIIIWS